MAEERIKETINFLLECLSNEFIKVDKIILFGSYSNWSATEDSDLDIGLISSNFNNKNIYGTA